MRHFAADRPLRVLVVTTTYPRHAEDHTPRFVADLCEHLVADHQLEVTVLAPHGPGLERRETLRGVHVERFRYAWNVERQAIAYGAGVSDNLRDSARARWQLPCFIGGMLASTVRLLRRHDLVHAHWAPPGAVAGLAGRLLRRPVVLTLHRIGRPYSRIERFAVEGADKVLFNSDYTWRQTISQGLRCHGEVAYQGFDQEAFRRPSEDAADNARGGDDLRQRLGIPEGAPLVASVARLVQFKGFSVLLAAAERFLAAHPATHVVIAGDGPEKIALERQAEASDFAARIHLPGPLQRPDVVRLFAAADLFVNPGIEAPNDFVETLGIAALEAAAMGVPGVGTRVGGIPETIVDGVTGLLVPPSDPEALAEAIDALLRDDVRRQAFGTAAAQRVEETFSWRHLAAQVVEHYGEVVRR